MSGHNQGGEKIRRRQRTKKKSGEWKNLVGDMGSYLALAPPPEFSKSAQKSREERYQQEQLPRETKTTVPSYLTYL